MADPRLSERLRELSTQPFLDEGEQEILEDAARLAELVEELQAAHIAALNRATDKNAARGSAALDALLAFDLSGGSQTGRDR